MSGSPGPGSLPPEVRALDEAIEVAEEAGDLDEVDRLEAQLWLDGATSPEGRVGGPARALFLDMNGNALRSPDPVRERPREPASERLERLDPPTHVLVGDLDLPHIVARAHLLADRIPHATVEVMTGVAHLPPLERPADVLASLERFMEVSG